MKTGGLSRARLDRLRKSMTGYVERGEVPGIVTLVCRHGEVHVNVAGNQSFDGPDPMRRDTIFRIASMSKPITAAATMILVEECKLRLDDAVEKWLPELANRKVLKHIDAPLDETVPAHRPITVRDLLTFTLGFGLLLTATGEYPILKAANELEIGMRPASKPQARLNPDEWIRSGHAAAHVPTWREVALLASCSRSASWRSTSPAISGPLPTRPSTIEEPVSFLNVPHPARESAYEHIYTSERVSDSHRGCLLLLVLIRDVQMITRREPLER